MALVLFSMGGLFAIYEGVEKLRHPHEVEQLPVAIGILLFAMVLEGWSLRTAYKEAKAHRTTSGRWLHWIRRSKQPELPVVLLEDTGALIGLVFALVGVSLAHATGNPRWDAVGSLAIGVAAGRHRHPAGDRDEGPADRRVGLAGRRRPRSPRRSRARRACSRIIHLRTEHLGPDQLLVAAKLEFDPALTVEQLADAIDVAERELRAVVPTAHFVFIEPDVYRAPAPA